MIINNKRKDFTMYSEGSQCLYLKDEVKEGFLEQITGIKKQTHTTLTFLMNATT